MFAVVVEYAEADPAKLATLVVEVLGGTAYDVRASLTVPGGGPAVLAVVAEPERAKEISAALAERGFGVSVADVKQAREYVMVRRFSLEQGSLEVEDRGGNQLSVSYGSVDVLIRASAVTTTVGTKTVREHKFSVGRSVLSGGLVNTKVVETKRVTRATDSDEMLYVYRGDELPLCFSEQTLQYQGLGAALQPSRLGNFLYTATELQERCAAARYDQRLRKRSVQTQMLGRTLGADDHVEFAVSLVARSLRGR